MERTQVIEKVAERVAYTASASGIYFGMTANDIAAFGSLAVAAIVGAATLYYKHKHYVLAREALDRRRASLGDMEEP